MRLLTFQIDGHRLAVPAEGVASVGKPYGKERTHPVDLRRRLGGRTAGGPGGAVITFRARRRLLEFAVDRVLNLEDGLETRLKPWPAALGPSRLFKGIIDLEGALYFLLDLESVSGEAGRAKR